MLKISVVSQESTSEIQAEPGSTLLAMLQRTGWHISAPCGGAGTCRKCVVHVDPADAAGEPTQEELLLIAKDPTARLACRCRPVGDLEVRLPDSSVSPSEGTDAKGGSFARIEASMPVISRLTVRLDPASLDDQRSLCERIQSASGRDDLQVDPRLIANSTDILSHENIELIVEEGGSGASRLVQLRTVAGSPVIGIAFDIGTTTVAAYLVDLESGMVLSSSSQANAQGSYGADVISRITAAGNGDQLGKTIREQLAAMTQALLRQADAATDTLCATTIVGNTTMLHLLLDLDAGPISKAPFIPTVTESIQVLSSSLGIDAPAGSATYLAPSVSSYVGADIVSDLIATGVHEKEKLSVLIDVGTNGEIVAGTRDRLLACSTAAGPAFEGGTITFGSAGIAGAISHVKRNGSEIEIETIGGGAARTICGTGLIDAVALLLEDGLVDETGRLELETDGQLPEAYRDRVGEYNNDQAVLLSDPAADHCVYITQSDIRQVQLAKGAIAAGVFVLLDTLGAAVEEIDRVYLAGGFGTYVRPAAALRVGLLPPVHEDHVEPVGNAAGAGAVALLLSADARRQAAEIRRSVHYLELSGMPLFQEHYMQEMMFPS